MALSAARWKARLSDERADAEHQRRRGDRRAAAVAQDVADGDAAQPVHEVSGLHRHCEERSDEAIQVHHWIASLRSQ